MAIEGGANYRLSLVNRQMRRDAARSEAKAKRELAFSRRAARRGPFGAQGMGYIPRRERGESGTRGLTDFVIEATGLPGAYRALPGGPKTTSKWDYLDAALLPVSIGLAIAGGIGGTAGAPGAGTAAGAAGGAAAGLGIRTGVKAGLKTVARGIDPGLELGASAVKSLPRVGKTLVDPARQADIAENIARSAGRVARAAGQIPPGGFGLIPATVEGVTQGAAAVRGIGPEVAEQARKGLSVVRPGSQVVEEQTKGPTVTRAAMAEPSKIIEPRSSVITTRPGAAPEARTDYGGKFNAQDYTMPKSLWDSIPEEIKTEKGLPQVAKEDEESGIVTLVKPKNRQKRSEVGKIIKDVIEEHASISARPGQPPSDSMINSTTKDAGDRARNIHYDNNYRGILDRYGVPHVIYSERALTPGRREELIKVFEDDNGKAWYYDTRTNMPADSSTDPNWINNEHVFAVSPESARQSAELDALDKALQKREDLTDADKTMIVRTLRDRHQKELDFVLNPNTNMLHLTRRANQRLVSSSDPSDKIDILYSGKTIKGVFYPPEGGKFLPVEEFGGEAGVLAPLHSTTAEMQNIIDNATSRVPSLTRKEAVEFRNQYTLKVKPLRDKLQRMKPETGAYKTTEEKLKKAEAALSLSYGERGFADSFISSLGF